MSWLEDRASCSKLVKLPNSLGIVPVRLLKYSLSSDTCPPLHVTLYQPQGALVSSHPLLLLQLSPPVLLYKATSASHSVDGISVTAAQSVAACAKGDIKMNTNNMA